MHKTRYYGLVIKFPALMYTFSGFKLSVAKIIRWALLGKVCSVDAQFRALVLGKIRQCSYKLITSKLVVHIIPHTCKPLLRCSKSFQ